ncbi:MAG: hypothetical protein IPJ37_22990 [Bacteroidales bacterium]|nr:hypothetical protein [Bacteroidales bacterium]
MGKFIRILTLLILVFSFSCEDQTFIIECSDCKPDEPVDAELFADLDPDYFYESLVQIWEGNLEDSILVGSYPAYSRTFTQSVILNKKYTISATYITSKGTFIAVDSATPRVKYEKAQCEEECFYVYDTKCNLKLKYFN